MSVAGCVVEMRGTGTLILTQRSSSVLLQQLCVAANPVLYFGSGRNLQRSCSSRPQRPQICTRWYSRARGPATRPPSSSSWAEVAVPTVEEFETQLLAFPRFKEDIDAKTCHELATSFTALLPPGGAYSGISQQKLAQEVKLQPQAYHNVVTMLLACGLSTIDLDRKGRLFRFSFILLDLLSAIGHEPSILSFMHLFSSMNNHEGKLEARENTLTGALYKENRARLTAIANRRQNVNALTLQGRLLQQQGRLDLAMKTFEQAEVAYRRSGAASTEPLPSPNPGVTTSGAASHPPKRKPSWDWELDYHLGIAEIRMEQGHLNLAKEALIIAAHELDSPDACFKLAGPWQHMVEEQGSQSGAGEVVMGLSEEEREEYLHIAAYAGHDGACVLLGKLERCKAGSPGVGKREVKQHELMAESWFGIARLGNSTAEQKQSP